jgi:hypothetical protein
MLNSTLKKFDESNAFFVILKNTNSTKLFTIAMEQQVFFYYFINYRGHYRKDVAIDTATEVNLLFKNFCFNQQKCIFEHY